jgi:unsaturated chondroitin disaccharide hydrolase
MSVSPTYVKQLTSAFEFSQKQVKNLIENHPDYYPMYTKQGKWKHDGEKWTHWCDGFLGGQMWIFHEHTGDKFWIENAIRYSKPLEPRQHDRAVHENRASTTARSTTWASSSSARTCAG